jgi:hypothetical protein
MLTGLYGNLQTLMAGAGVCLLLIIQQTPTRRAPA